MNPKKEARQELERKRFVMFQVGLVVALSFSLLAFEWMSVHEPIAAYEAAPDDVGIIDIMTPITRHRPPEITKPTPVNKPSHNIVIVEELYEEPNETEEKDPLDDFDPDDLFSEEPTGGTGTDLPLEPFIIVENMPCACECANLNTEKARQKCTDLARRKYLGQNTKYPWDAKELGEQGTVYVSYVVDARGNITDLKAMNRVHPSLDREALRVVKNMPCVKPGKQRGAKVPVKFTIPIKFVLHP